MSRPSAMGLSLFISSDLCGRLGGEGLDAAHHRVQSIAAGRAEVLVEAEPGRGSCAVGGHDLFGGGAGKKIILGDDDPARPGTTATRGVAPHAILPP